VSRFDSIANRNRNHVALLTAVIIGLGVLLFVIKRF